MAKEAGKLTARGVATLKEPGRHSDGRGLYLNVTGSGTRSWLFMWKIAGRRREMGLGSFPTVSLADARKKAADARRLIAAGLDPIAERQKASDTPTFGDFADQIAADVTANSRSARHKAQWRETLTLDAAALRSKHVDQITTADVLAVLKPIWQAKHETASRLRGRIERVLNAAKAKGYRTGENPAAWRGHLDNLLPKRRRVDHGHHEAMLYADVPAFVARLRERQGEAIAALALEFCILTAARSGEVLGARWTEIDLDAAIWTIPADRMKAGRAHRVPLTARALAIVRQMKAVQISDFVFPGLRHDRPLSPTVLYALMRRMDVAGTVHGFRSSFRDWAGNETHHPREVAEHALAHVIGDKAEQAYSRSDALKKRRALMDAWAAHCDAADRGANVIPITRPV